MNKYIFSIILLTISYKSLGGPYEIVIETPVKSVDGVHLKDNSVALDRLETNGADHNDVLFFDGLEWKPAPLTGLSFVGGWDARNNDPVIDESSSGPYQVSGIDVYPSSGDYLVVTEGRVDGSWNKGDWIVFNGELWERVNNTGSVLSIFNRGLVNRHVTSQIGDYRWDQIDLTNSSIFDLHDILTPDDLADHEGHLLKWNSSSKKFELSEDGQGVAPGTLVETDNISGVENVDISSSAAIDLTKIDGFDSTTGFGKLKTTGGTVSNLNIQGNNLKAGTAGKVVIKRANDPDKEIVFNTLFTNYDTLLETFNGKESLIPANTDTAKFLSGGVDNAGNREWHLLTLEIATEGTNHKLHTQANVWGSVLSDYDVSNLSLPLQVQATDSLKSAIGKLEVQLNSEDVIDTIPTSRLGVSSVDYETDFDPNFSNTSGILYLGEETDEQKTWSLKMSTGVQYKGTWDPTLEANPPVAEHSGDYYIVAIADSSLPLLSTISYNEGDWAIYNGTTYEQINNTGLVKSFNGRQGEIVACPGNTGCNADEYDYSWKMLKGTGDIAFDSITGKITQDNKKIEGSKLQDIMDVQTPGASNHQQILKRNANNNGWILANENVGVGATAQITLDNIADEAIKNIHIAATPVDGTATGIKITQIADSNSADTTGTLQTDLDKKFSLDGSISMLGNIDMGSANIVHKVANVKISEEVTDPQDASQTITETTTYDMSKVINYASSAYQATELAEFHNSSDFPNGSETQILLNTYNSGTSSSEFSVENLDTITLEEGLNNHYFTTTRVLESKNFPTTAALDAVINYGTQEKLDDGELMNSFDSLGDAIKKVYKKLDDLPEPIVTGNDLPNGSIPLSKLADADEIGDTITYLGGEWVHRSISGLQLKGDWLMDSDPAAINTPPDSDLVEGDYYMITNTGKFDAVTYADGDWAVFQKYNGTDPVFSKISRQDYIKSFKASDGVERTNVVAAANDYTFNMLTIGTDSNDATTWSPLSLFTGDIGSYSSLDSTTALDTNPDKNKILSWNDGTSKWEAVDDQTGVDIGGLTFSTTQGSKAITNEDIASIDFSHVYYDTSISLADYFSSNFIDLSSPSFSSGLSFSTTDTNANGALQTYNIGSTSNPITFKYTEVDNSDPSNPVSTTHSLTTAVISDNCSNLSTSNFETKFTGEENSENQPERILNGDREFVNLTPDMLEGTQAQINNLMYDPAKIRALGLVGFAEEGSDFNINSETTLINVFNKLAGKVESFRVKASNGIASKGSADIGDSGSIELDDSFHGQMIFVDGKNVQIDSSVADNFEITIKRVDSNPVEKITIELNSGTIEDQGKITLASNYSSVTLKKVDGSFYVLRRSGSVN